MASRPPIELDDQSDEDFFDKLVVDDDDITAGSFKATELKTHDIDNGPDSDDVKMFGRLSPDSDELNIFADLSKYSDRTKAFAKSYSDLEESKTLVKLNNDSDEVNALANSGDDSDELKVLANLSNGSDEVKAFANLSLGQNGNGFDDIKVIRSDDGDDSEGKSDQEKDQNVEEAGPSSVSAGSLSFGNGLISNEHVIKSNAESELTSSQSSDSARFGMKEVQWSAFADSVADVGKGFGSYSDFYSELGEGATDDLTSESNIVSSDLPSKISNSEYVYSYPGHQGEEVSYVGNSVNEQELISSLYWENSYPGWKYDAISGQWYQVDGHDVTENSQQSPDNGDVDMLGNTSTNAQTYLAVSGCKSAHGHETAQSFFGTVNQSSLTENVTTWNQVSQPNSEYPAHIVFDQQHPGWLYDTNEQKWVTLEQYHSVSQSMFQAYGAHVQNGCTRTLYSNDSDLSSQQQQDWSADVSGYTQHGTNARQPGVWSQGKVVTDSRSGQQYQKAYVSDSHLNDHVAPEKPFNSMATVTSYMSPVQGNGISNWGHSLNKFVPNVLPDQQFNMPVETEQNGHVQYPINYNSSQKAFGLSEQFLPDNHASHSMKGRRSSAGRPPHALVAFGFGGKLIVMKTSGSQLHGMKDAEGGPLSLINLMEVVTGTNTASGIAADTSGYFNALCHQSFPGPLVGGNVGGKDLNNWIEEQISRCQSSNVDYRKGKSLKLLLSLLKIAYQHYGKFRSLSTDTVTKENDLPELAVANLFASAEGNIAQHGAYASGTKCLKNCPSQAQIQATASEVQNLLINGKKGEALQRAQEGQLWEFALILAHELGDQFYNNTLRHLALSQLVDGTPLRTLCLLIARGPQDVFTSTSMAGTGLPASGQINQQHDQSVGCNMLDNWEENLAIIIANKTENDDLVITHLGDCLWKERNDIIAAHVCYLVTGADAHIQAYSDSARLCLIGADHWNFPRTYATPEAIQRTEFYEHSKVLGNTQYVLLQFQPYKLIYAHMLAEVGKVSDSLKYCQAMHKSLKAGRSPEADILKRQLSSLEERLRMHQQGGYAANLAPAKIVGKLLNFFDNTAHRVVGGPSPPVPPTTQNSFHSNEMHNQMTKVSSSPSVMAMSSLTPSSAAEYVSQWAVDSNQVSGAGVSGGQSTMGMPSLITSASMEPASQWAVDDNKMAAYNRSISEPAIGRTTEQDHDSSSRAISSGAESKASTTTGLSRLSRFNIGAHILQKTVGLVMKPRQGQQAKLGEQNKFYFDKTLNKWVEEGAQPTAEEATPPPPPTTACFQNPPNAEGHVANSIPESRNESSSGIPLVPPSTNQFSARSRISVRARYVDTFNKGKGGASPANNFQTPILPSVKPTRITSAKFFVPSPTSINEQASEMVDGNTQGAPESGDSPSVSMSQPSEKKSSPLVKMPNTWMMESVDDSHSSGSQHTTPWSGGQNNFFSPAKMHELNPSSEVLGTAPLSNMSSDVSSADLQTGGNLGDELHEVEL